MTARDSLMIEARDRARRVHIRPDVMAAALLAQRGDRPFVTEIEDRTSGESFFRVTQEGPTRVLYLNIGHPFYATIYDPPGATAQYRAAVEVFLWTLGISELDAPDREHDVYVQERRVWSEHLRVAAPILDELLDYPGARALEADEEWADDNDEPLDPRDEDPGLTVAEKNGER
jgi:hypothetical protein